MGKIADYLKYYNIYSNITPTVNGYTSAFVRSLILSAVSSEGKDG